MDQIVLDEICQNTAVWVSISVISTLLTGRFSDDFEQNMAAILNDEPTRMSIVVCFMPLKDWTIRRKESSCSTL